MKSSNQAFRTTKLLPSPRYVYKIFTDIMFGQFLRWPFRVHTFVMPFIFQGLKRVTQVFLCMLFLFQQKEQKWTPARHTTIQVRLFPFFLFASGYLLVKCTHKHSFLSQAPSSVNTPLCFLDRVLVPRSSFWSAKRFCGVWFEPGHFHGFSWHELLGISQETSFISLCYARHHSLPCRKG